MRHIVASLFLLFALAGVAAAEIDTEAVRSKAEAANDGGLKSRADALLSSIDKAKEKVAEAETGLAEAADDAKEAAQAAVDEAEQALQDGVDELQIYSDVMKERDLDVEAYQIVLLESGGIELKNLSGAAAVGLIGKWVEQGKDWVVEKGPGIIVKIILFLVVLFIFKILAGIAGKVTKKSLELSRLKTPDLLKNFFVNVVTKAVMIAGLLIALMVINVPIAPLLAGIGVLGFVVGFALQDTLANFAAGIMLLLYRPYDIGDFVTAGGVTGSVSSMSLVSTTLLTPDNQVQVIPNGSIWGGVITNVTANDTRRVDLTMGIGYDDDIKKAEKVMLEVVTSHPLVLKDPAPTIRLHNLGESSVDFVVRPWTKTSDYWDVYWDLSRALKMRFDEEGISIPYPQRDIHIIQGEAPAAAKS